MLLKKKILSALTAAACLVSSICIIGTGVIRNNKAEATSLTGKSPFEITSQMTIGWNLGNSLESTNDSYAVDVSPRKFATAWGNPEPTEELIDAVKAGGFNTIRIPVTWYQHLIYNSATDTYEISDDWMAYVKKFVDYAYESGMFVILNVHHENWVNVAQFTDTTYNEAAHKLKDIWTRVSTEFKDYDQHLIFEGMNEPRQTGNPNVNEWGSGDAASREYINKLEKVFVETVRGQGSAANSERLLMLPGYCASSDANAVSAIETPSSYGNVALSVHAYLPYFFAMDTSEYSNHNFPGQSGYGENYEASIKSFFSQMKSISDSKNVPIVIGEFSASDFENTSSREAWAECYLSNAKAAGIPCVLWDNNVPANGSGEAHGYIYRSTNTWYPNSLSVVKKMMDTLGITGYSLPEYKEYVRPAFSWDKVNIGSDWIEIFRAENGKYTINADGEPYEWGNFTVQNWRNYINENYKLVMFYDSESEPTLVFQGGWYTVTPNDDMSADFTVGFTYEDIVKTLTANGVTVSEMDNLFLSASGKLANIYGLYAVPVNSVINPTEPPTETPTGSHQTDKGDVNGDHNVNVTDLVMLQKYLVNLEQFNDSQMTAADYNSDNIINVFDSVSLRNHLTLDY